VRMRALGLAVSVTLKRTTVAAVVLDRADEEDAPNLAAPVLVDSFEIKSDQSDLATQIFDAAEGVRGRLRSLAPDVVVVRRADRSRQATNQESPRVRLLVEGAITAASRQVVLDTVIRTGKDCASAYGTSKDVLDADASKILGGKYANATAAALSGLASA
jgi:hypothetical protein